MLLQQHVRGWLGRRHYVSCRESVIKLQSFVRCFASRNRWRHVLFKIKLLQAHARGMLCRRLYARWCRSAVIVQTLWRSHIACCNYNMQRAAALKIQTQQRGMIAQRRFRTICRQTFLLQTWWRMMSRQKLLWLPLRSAVIKLQTFRRCIVAKRKLAVAASAVMFMQKHIRGMLVRQRWWLYQTSVVTMQRIWRGKYALHTYKILRISAVRLQAWCRGVSQRKLFLFVIASVRKIVGFLRTCYAVKCWNQQKRAAVILTKHWRGIVCRRQFQQQRKAVVILQASVDLHVNQTVRFCLQNIYLVVDDRPKRPLKYIGFVEGQAYTGYLEGRSSKYCEVPSCS